MSTRNPRRFDPDPEDDDLEPDYLDADEYGIGDDDVRGEEADEDEIAHEALMFFRVQG